MSNMVKVLEGQRPEPAKFKLPGQVGEKGVPNTSTQPGTPGGPLRLHNGKVCTEKYK